MSADEVHVVPRIDEVIHESTADCVCGPDPQPHPLPDGSTGYRVFRVLGDGGTSYTAVISFTGASCSCDAGRRGVLCSHLLAARVLIDREQVAA